MKKAIVTMTLVAFFGVAAQSQAEAKKKATKTTTKSTTTTTAPAHHEASESTHASGGQTYKKMRYGMAGCGLGAMLIEKNTALPQIGSGILSSLSATQTFGITTGTSNCQPDQAGHAKVEQEVFLRTNLASLTREAAQGTGEHLSAFAEVLGCDHGAFSKMSQEKYNEIYSTSESQTVLQNYVKQIKANPALTCTRVS